MVAAAQPQKRLYTPEEYLALEREAEFKSEYFHGEIYAMAGSSPEHSTITINISREVSLQLKGKPCQAFSNDMKVRTTPTGLFAYPDLSVVCGEPRFHDSKRDVLVNPTVLFEVLSSSTEAYDRGKKFAQYQEIESLTDYVLIAQDEPRIEHFRRQPDDQWLLTVATGLASKIRLASIECTLSLSEVYDRVKFEEKAPFDRADDSSTA